MLNLDSNILEQVVTTAKAKAASDSRWINAIDRAASELVSNPYIEIQGDHLLIGSPSGNVYSVNGTCQCEAYEHRKPCWHRACKQLLVRYNDVSNQTQDIRQQAQAAYRRANSRNRPLFADRDAEAMRRQALAEDRAELIERREKARREMAELFN